jgi:Arc/MetJ family transcription regulator
MHRIAILHIWHQEMAMKKTTVFIEEQLLEKAIQATGARTKKEVIAAGLQSLVRIHNRELFRKELGTFDIDLTLDELKESRNAD